MITCKKTAIAAIGGLLVWMFGPWDTLVSVLLAFVVLDYITGLINAGIKHDLKSSVGFIGLAKKVMIFLLVALAALLDRVVPTNGAIRAAVCLFYIANEGISILENAGAIGLPLPDKLKETLARPGLREVQILSPRPIFKRDWYNEGLSVRIGSD